MKTPREKYQHDNRYRALVDLLAAYIDQCQFTPSELREAVILARIIYEERQIRVLPRVPEMPDSVIEALEIQKKWLDEVSKL